MELGKLKGKLKLILASTPKKQLPEKIRFTNKEGKTFNLTIKPSRKQGPVKKKRLA